MDKADITFFDPKADWTVVERGLPHWSQASCVCFVTWRLNDSLPIEALERIDRELATLLRDEGFDPDGDWKQQLAQQPSKRRGEIQWRLFRTRDKFMDEGFGECLLTDSRCSKIVLDAGDNSQHFQAVRRFSRNARQRHAYQCPHHRQERSPEVLHLLR